MNFEQIIFVAIVIGAVFLFTSDRMRIDVSAMIVLLALAFTGILTPGEALAGFSSEPAIVVAAVFVISAGVASTGLADRIGVFVARAAGGGELRAVIVIMPIVAMLSALSHHLMITAMMLPILVRLSRDRQIPVSRLLMPMSLSASLGTTLTLFSAPAFLLTSSMLQRQGSAALGVFAITPIGIALVVVSTVFMISTRWLLPRHDAQTDEAEYLQLTRYYTEVVILPESPWAQKTLQELQAHFRGQLKIVEWLRRNKALSRMPDATIETGDVFIVLTSPDEMASIESEPGIQLHAVVQYGEATRPEGEEPQLVQVVVAPQSPFIDSTIAQIDFLKTMNVIVIGLWRKDEWLYTEMSRVRLHEGDVLVLRGVPSTFAELSRHRGFLMMVPFTAETRYRHRAMVAVGIIAAVVIGAVLEVMPVQLLFLAAAVLMVVTRCVSVEQAYREIDTRVYVMIAGVVPLGAAMEKTGMAVLIAGYMQESLTGWSSLAILLTVFWAAALLTQILSDAATVVLLVPVALAIAVGLGLPPEPFAVCTALGAVAAFLTPIGHHGNLLILSPGRYTFADFLRVGVPLTVLISLVSTWLARYIWLGGPLLPV